MPSMPSSTSVSNSNAAQTPKCDKPSLPEYDESKCSSLYSEVELMRYVADYISDCTLSMGYEENYLISNVRIFITGLACLIGFYATAVVKFPEEIALLKLCVTSFFGLLLLLLLLEIFFVKSAVIAVYDKRGERMVIDSYLNRSAGELVLGIRQGGRELTHSKYIGAYFDTEGYLVTDNLFKDLKQILVDFECGITDESKDLVKRKDSYKQK